MKSAVECFKHADKCEKMALDSVDEKHRSMLRGVAVQWRILGFEATERDPVGVADRPQWKKRI
jgi:hypothetical protein